MSMIFWVSVFSLKFVPVTELVWYVFMGFCVCVFLFVFVFMCVCKFVSRSVFM